MDSSSPLTLHPAILSPGTEVGAWRIEGWAGRGVYGAVYRAVPLQDEQASLVALKLALLPEDPRFPREVELLSRLDDPSIPRLLDHGSWPSPSGTRHPFLVMQWVDGVPLYDGARRHPPSPAQVRRWLAQLAHALAALHAQGLVHRDVKGDNVLVRRSDGRAMLMDFGSGIYPGAATLTPPMWFPGTPAYRSPESWLFELRFYRDATARYLPSPADDLYALGVTACRLLTGEYPELADPSQDEDGLWHLNAMIPPPALLSSPQVEPALRALILRLFSVHPEQRGTAAQLAEELAQETPFFVPESPLPSVARQAPPLVPRPPKESAEAPAPKPYARVPLQEVREPLTVQSSVATSSAESFRSRVPAWRGWPWLALAAAGLALAVWAWPEVPGEALAELSLACVSASEVGENDAGTRGLGEVAAAVSMEQAPSRSHRETIAEDVPPKPLPGQTRPNEKGRCPLKWQISLNGGCWVRFSQEREACDHLSGQLFKGLCYVPIIPPGRSPTSSPVYKP
ncbi:serine/threonine-protein kinase [Hyalangium sp.]|uniref:serine/threonine protein kinase n=1 Tax=Hyalangium sp. TaxID=2028555 RepID=UPI002D43D021|nr:serine/threonine-protein kinase [Hyalangium sp.]HYI00782.1 serine/threonine-protein kinase [Hyalangium sp.]